jgi:ApeA N-terminal domain 1
MAQQKIRTGCEFEFEGFWWEPQDGEPRPAQGHLSYKPSEGVELSIVDLRPDPNAVFRSAEPIPVLHGHNLQGKPCTLFDLIPTTIEGHPFGGHTREVLQSNSFVYGLHLSDIDELMVNHAAVSVRGLREWVNHYWTPPRYEGESDDEQVAPVPDLLENDVLGIPLDGARLIFQRGVATPNGTLAQNQREAHVNVRFEMDHPLNYRTFVERYVVPLHDLIVLATHEESEVEGTTIFVPSEEVKWWGRDRPSQTLDNVAVIERTSIDPSLPRPNAFAQIPMPLRAWGVGAPQIIRRWFALRAELGGPGNLLFATLNKRDVSLENDTLSLLSVAEGYHRTLYDNPPLAETTHEAAVESMLAALSAQDEREHYRSRLRFANQQSQKQRLRFLFERAEEVVEEAESWRRVQLQEAIDTRNFLTHWGEPTERVLEDWDLWFALNRLRIVLEINLYLDVGIDLDTIEVAIRTAYQRRAFLKPA